MWVELQEAHMSEKIEVETVSHMLNDRSRPMGERAVGEVERRYEDIRICRTWLAETMGSPSNPTAAAAAVYVLARRMATVRHAAFMRGFDEAIASEGGRQRSLAARARDEGVATMVLLLEEERKRAHDLRCELNDLRAKLVEVDARWRRAVGALNDIEKVVRCAGVLAILTEYARTPAP